MWTKENLWELRQEIRLCSLYVTDYQNSFGVAAGDCCNFFDWYADFLANMMEEDCIDIGTVDKFMVALERYDTSENLYYYYGCFDYDPLLIT